MFDAIQVVASGYFLPDEVLCGQTTSGLNVLTEEQGCRSPVTVLNDNIDCTCVNTTQGDRQLQVVLNFSKPTTGHQISLEVILKHGDDCHSPTWIWFVESTYQNGNIMAECAIAAKDHWAVFSRCVITCVCRGSCDYLYFKYNQIQFHKNQVQDQLCEIRLAQRNWTPHRLGVSNWKKGNPLISGNIKCICISANLQNLNVWDTLTFM